MEKRHSTYLILGCLVWAVLGTSATAYYYTQYTTYRHEYSNLAKQLDSVSIRVNVLLSYGNETRVWQNSTVLPLNSTAFIAISTTAADLDYTDYGGELGILITAINGVAGNSTCGWFYWYWDSQNSHWMLPEYSAAKHILHDGDTIAFAYSDFLGWPPPPPT